MRSSKLEALGDVRDSFRRARAATAARYLRRGQFEEAVYEALHADAARMADPIAAGALDTAALRQMQ
jgi:hypothetical protein